MRVAHLGSSCCGLLTGPWGKPLACHESSGKAVSSQAGRLRHGGTAFPQRILSTVGVRLLAAVLLLPCLRSSAVGAPEDDAYYTEEQVYGSRPNPKRKVDLGPVGVTGLVVRIDPGVIVRVQETVPDTPAHGKFKEDEIITGVNGVALRGRNPIVALGSALTEAEATDGELLFEVQEKEDGPLRKVPVSIPVLGAYSETWPLHCAKSRKIIRQAAEFYATDKEYIRKYFEPRGVEGALACLFLLSTGDDKYLPRVKDYLSRFLANIGGVGDHTWNNGYNGIVSAEYYLRIGDKSVLPLLQYYCEDARRRQKFGCGWVHWGTGISPGYVAGGLMNPAGAQLLTTLLLGKECGLQVDEKTLLGALRFWWRFTGHGTVPYGDHRPEGGLGSNGKDGMSAAAMLIASGARGNVSIYKKAADYLSMSMITSYPVLSQGHGDAGRGDAIWRGIASTYLMDKKPAAYHGAMNRLRWWYDLCRRPSGGFGVSTCYRFNDIGSGAAIALAYTASLKTLRITGAPRSRHAKAFTLPEWQWGTAADLEFLSIEHGRGYREHGAPEPIHVPFFRFGSAYMKPSFDPETVSKQEILKNIHHARYMIRAQAAKALRTIGAFDELESLLDDKDPRVRRAALDGLIDYRYWFGIGKGPIKAEQMTPRMIASIRRILGDPEEAWWVVDGALMAMKLAPVEAIEEALPLIRPWTTHEEWWLRDASFQALAGLQKDDGLFLKHLPTMITMVTDEYHTQPRARMTGILKKALQDKGKESPAGEFILAALIRAARESVIIPDQGPVKRSSEGAYNVILALNAALQQAPEQAVVLAQVIKSRFEVLGTGEIINLVASPNSNPEQKRHGLYTAREKLPPDGNKALTAMLYDDFRPELMKRWKAERQGGNVAGPALTNTVTDLTALRNPNAGWTAIGTPPPADRVWRFVSVDPPVGVKLDRAGGDFCQIPLPAKYERWYLPEFDDRAWNHGRAPIGVGVFKQRNASFESHSPWGDGEFLLARTTFELGEHDYESYRISVLANRGFTIYLNGRQIHNYIWWKTLPHYRPIPMNADQVKLLKKGTNTLAVYAKSWLANGQQEGQIDVFLEGLSLGAPESADK